MNAELVVRRMRDSEAPETAELIAGIIGPLSYYNERARREELAKYNADKLISMIAGDADAVLLAEAGNRLLGFAISYYDDGLLWLSWFGVASNARGQGAGRRLLTAVEESAPRRDAHKVWCDTRTENVESARVLTNAGYTRICELADHWYGQDFFLWEKRVHQ